MMEPEFNPDGRFVDQKTGFEYENFAHFFADLGAIQSPRNEEIAFLNRQSLTQAYDRLAHEKPGWSHEQRRRTAFESCQTDPDWGEERAAERQNTAIPVRRGSTAAAILYDTLCCGAGGTGVSRAGPT